MANLIVLSNAAENNTPTLETLIELAKAAVKGMPAEVQVMALDELQTALAGASWMMIAGDEIDQETGARLYYVTLADFLDNCDLWYGCQRPELPPVYIIPQ